MRGKGVMEGKFEGKRAQYLKASSNMHHSSKRVQTETNEAVFMLVG